MEVRRLEKLIETATDPIGDFTEEIERQTQAVKQYEVKLKNDLEQAGKQHKELLAQLEVRLDEELRVLQGQFDATREINLQAEQELAHFEQRVNNDMEEINQKINQIANETKAQAFSGLQEEIMKSV